MNQYWFPRFYMFVSECMDVKRTQLEGVSPGFTNFMDHRSVETGNDFRISEGFSRGAPNPKPQSQAKCHLISGDFRHLGHRDVASGPPENFLNSCPLSNQQVISSTDGLQK